MVENLREIVLGVLAAGLTTALGWTGRTYLWRRKLRRKQAFFGLPDSSECLLIVNRHASSPDDWSVHRTDVYAFLELAALIKECGAQTTFLPHDGARQGFGERTEFCVGGPASNRRMAAHLRSLLPGVGVNTDAEPGPERGAFTVGGERYRVDPGHSEHVLLARLTAGQSSSPRPVFLLCGQTGVTNQAAARYLARHHERLARKYGTQGNFCLLLRVVNPQAYGPDMTELVGDVTTPARTAPAATGAARHRATS